MEMSHAGSTPVYSEPPLLHFKVFGTPITQGSMVPGRRQDDSLYVRPAFGYSLGKWRGEIREVTKAEMKRAGLEMRPGSVRCDVTFWFNRPESHFKTRRGHVTNEMKQWAPVYWVGNKDIDKMLRAVLDSLQQAKLFRADNRVVHVERLLKLYGETDGLELSVWDAIERVDQLPGWQPPGPEPAAEGEAEQLALA